MNRLHNLRIRTHLLLAFGIILAVMIAQSILVYRVAQINRNADEWVEHTLRVIALADEARTVLVNMQTGYRGFLLTGEERYLEPYESGRATYQSLLEQLRRATADSPEQMARWAEIEARAEAWQREVTEPGIVVRRDAGDDGASIDDVIAFAERDLDKQQFDEIRRVFGEAITVEDQLLQERAADSERATDQLQLGVVGGTIASVGLSVLVVLHLSRSIGGGITELAAAARRMADGDFNARVPTTRSDEIGVTGSAFDRMASRLQEVIAQLEQTAATAQASEERSRAIVNGVGEGIITFEDNGGIDSINPAAEEIFGYSAESIQGRALASLITSNAIIRPGSPDTGNVRYHEAIGRHANGTPLALVCTTTTINAGGQRRHIVVVRDVTAARKAEAEARRREQEFTALVERSTSPVVRFDRDVRYLYVNPAHERIVQRSADQLVGKRMDEITRDPSYARYWHTNIDAVVASREERTIEFPARTSTGVRWFNARLYPEIGPSGSVESVLAISQEVTERKRMEETLRESEVRFRSAFDAAPIGIALTTIEGRYIRVNAMMSAMVGYSVEELQSLDYQSITHPADREDQERLLEELVNEEREIVQIEKRYLHRDGHPVHALLSISAIRDADGKPAYLVAQAIDMTSRKEAEEARDRLFRQIERARSEVRAILDASNDVMILISPQGTVLTVNRRVEDMFGIDMEMVVGSDLDDLTEAIQRVFGTTERFNSLAIQRVNDPSGVFTDTIQQQWPMPRELELHSSPVEGADGEHLGRLFVLRDVTHQREVDRMKTEFVSLVSHELRTPLTSIKGYVDLLIDGEVGEMTDQQRSFLEIVENNARRLVALINDLLDISRIEAGRVELNRTALDIRASVKSVVTSFSPQLAAKQQSIDVRLPDRIPTVWGDPDRVIQILTNLISNAHKYTPAGGTITVSARRAGTQVMVDVSDTGVGMAPDEVEKLFTKFYRAKNRATQQVGGTGLGLAITRSLVEMLGGEITVRSTPGEGATFSFSLPIRIVTGSLGT